jgi:hypothetical protein
MTGAGRAPRRRLLLGAVLVVSLGAAGGQVPLPPPPGANAPGATPAPPPAAAPPKPPPPAAPTSAKPPPPAAKATPPPPNNVETLKQGVATSVLGRKVRDPAGADMGPVVDVLVDRRGSPLAAVIDFGGFLGVGSRKIAIDWQLLQFNPNEPDAPILLALDRAEVQAAPEYKPGAKDVKIVGPPAVRGQAAMPEHGK